MAGQVVPSEQDLQIQLSRRPDNIETPIGGKVKVSDVLGTIGTIGSAVPVIGPVIGAFGAIGKGISKLFGGKFTRKELEVLQEIHRRVGVRNEMAKNKEK